MSRQVSKMPEPPDLQALIALRGGYDKITAEDWKAYDHQWLVTTEWLAGQHKVGGKLIFHRGDRYYER